MIKRQVSALAVVCALGPGAAIAQQAGDWLVGAGWLHFAPQDSSKPLTLTAPVPAVLPGAYADVGSADTLGLNVIYFIDSHWAIEGVMGIPPKFKLTGIGTLERLGELGEARQWSPTLLGRYYFNEGTDKFRPFVSLGGTYVWYSDVSLTTSLQGALGNQFHQPPLSTTTTAKLDSSFAPVVNVGVAYQFDPHWGVSLSVSYLWLKTTAKLTTTSAFGVPVGTSQSSLKVNPIVSYLSLTYKF